MSKINFLVTSDIHAGIYNGEESIRLDKCSDIQKIIDRQTNTDVILIVGDLLDTGANGSPDCQCFPNNGCASVKIVEHTNELEIFKKFLTNFEQSKIYLTLGNHDTYTTSIYTAVYKFFTGKYPLNTVQGLVYQKHGSYDCYSFTKRSDAGSLKFICLGIYPDSNAISYLKRTLIMGQPTVLYFHYNLDGPFSDWWSDENKDIFYETVKSFNIKCICVGHHHETYVRKWRGIEVVSGAGSDSLMSCTYVIQEGELEGRMEYEEI